MNKCILKACPWVKPQSCKLLGQCGAAYALEQSRAPGGYEVVSGIEDNPTIRALASAGLVTVYRRSTETKRSRYFVKAVKAILEAAE